MNRLARVNSLVLMWVLSAIGALHADGTLIYSVGIDGTGFKIEVPNGSFPEFPVFSSAEISPNGERLMFNAFLGHGRDRDAKILIMDIAGLTKGDLYDLDWGICPVWSPDGKMIAFEACELNPKGFEPGIWIMKADGSDARRISDGERPRWHPNGEFVISTIRTPSLQLVKVDIKSKESTPFLTEYNHLEPIRWSSDGKRILALIERNQTRQIVTMNPDGTAESMIELVDGRISNPVFSRDGRWVSYFVINQKGLNDIYIVAADGTSEARKLDATPLALKLDHCWMHDGTRILFSARSARPITNE